MKNRKAFLGLLAGAVVGSIAFFVGCKSAPATQNCSSGTDVTETPLSGGVSCVTNIADDAPAWIRDNFHCVTVQVCDTTYRITTNDLPPYKTGYYDASSPNYVAFDTQGGTRHKNPNTIASQNITFNIPKTPTYKSTNLDATQGMGIDAVGISTYGVVIFNNQAAPGDSLTTEYQTMDPGEGHPQNTGKYHHHTDPILLTNADERVLIGVALDGYPIYGKQSQDGSYPTLDATTNSVACTTTEFPDGTYCYHVANGSGVNAVIFKSYLRGAAGTVE